LYNGHGLREFEEKGHWTISDIEITAFIMKIFVIEGDKINYLSSQLKYLELKLPNAPNSDSVTFIGYPELNTIDALMNLEIENAQNVYTYRTQDGLDIYLQNKKCNIKYVPSYYYSEPFNITLDNKDIVKEVFRQAERALR
jgi:hypothetical protein